MPRTKRNIIDDGVYHVLNRGNCRIDIFTKDADFAAFVTLLEQARGRFPKVRILGYCLMNNHWHLVLWPDRAADLSKFMQWLCTTHVRRWRADRGSGGEGHLYQGRFKSFPIERDEHLLTVLRYVESNPFRAKMVRRAEAWPWSSLVRGAGVNGARVEIAPWPIERPRDWLELVNERIETTTLNRIHTSVARGRPFGDEKWVARMAKRLGLERTLRNPWRPRRKNLVD